MAQTQLQVGEAKIVAAEADVRVAEANQAVAAAQVGVELQPLWGQQAAGWVSALPLGRTVAERLIPT